MWKASFLKLESSPQNDMSVYCNKSSENYKIYDGLYYGNYFFPLKYVRFFSTEKCYEGRIGKESRSYVSIN